MRSLTVLLLLFGCSQPSGTTTGDGGPPGDGMHYDGLGNGDGNHATSALTIIVTPNAGHASELVTAIDGATQSVYMTMYEIDHAGVLSALVARKQAGLDVQVVLDGSTTTKSFNTAAYNQLHTAGIDIVWANPTFAFTHEKTVMIDNKQAWIMTMNANTSSPTDNREYLAVDNDPTDVAEAVAIFKADHAMQTISPSGSLVVANNNARPDLVQLIGSATKTLDVEVEEFSDTYSTGIVNAVAAAAHRGVVTRVIVANAAPVTPPITTVKAQGAKVVMTGPTSDNGTSSDPYIHAKAIVIDCVSGTCAKGFVGSENFSGGSLGYNRELGVIFDSATELAKVEAAINVDFAAGVAQ